MKKERREKRWWLEKELKHGVAFSFSSNLNGRTECCSPATLIQRKEREVTRPRRRGITREIEISEETAEKLMRT